MNGLELMRAIKKIGKFRHRSVFQIISVQKNCNLKKVIIKMTKIRNLGKKVNTPYLR